jgi:hypothetical protein
MHGIDSLWCHFANPRICFQNTATWLHGFAQQTHVAAFDCKPWAQFGTAFDVKQWRKFALANKG